MWENYLVDLFFPYHKISKKFISKITSKQLTEYTDQTGQSRSKMEVWDRIRLGRTFCSRDLGIQRHPGIQAEGVEIEDQICFGKLACNCENTS